jgi:hypothetical protein
MSEIKFFSTFNFPLDKIDMRSKNEKVRFLRGVFEGTSDFYEFDYTTFITEGLNIMQQKENLLPCKLFCKYVPSFLDKRDAQYWDAKLFVKQLLRFSKEKTYDIESFVKQLVNKLKAKSWQDKAYLEKKRLRYTLVIFELFLNRTPEEKISRPFYMLMLKKAKDFQKQHCETKTFTNILEQFEFIKNG